MSAQHTPGPWRVDQPRKSRRIRAVETGYYITEHVRSAEDAALIAAAPDLLEALRRLLVEMGEGSARGRAIDLVPEKTIRNAYRALAKAEGAA